MDPQAMLNAAAASHQGTIALPDATQTYNQSRNAAAKLRVSLTRKDQTILFKHLGYPVVQDPKFHTSSDHAILVALRQLVRDEYYDTFRIKELRAQTLVVGAAARELFDYRFKPNFHFHFHCSEGADSRRIFSAIFEQFLADLEERAAGRLEPLLPGKKPIRNKHTVKMIHDSFSSVLSDYADLHEMHDQFTVKLRNGYTTLLLEDSAYNLDAYGWVELFRKTGAANAYGYMLLPLELKFSDYIDNDLYRIKREPLGQVSLVYAHGTSNGYIHRYNAWSFLLNNLGIHNSDFNVVFELHRVGPMVYFSAVRTDNSLNLVRSICVPKAQHFCLVFDFDKSVCRHTGVVRNKTFFSVPVDEWHRSVNYLTNLKTELINKQTTAAYVRRRIDGAALVSRELVEAWSLQQGRLRSFVLAVYLYVLAKERNDASILDYLSPNVSFGSIVRSVIKSYVLTLSGFSTNLQGFLAWCFSLDDPSFFVQFPAMHEDQYFSCPVPENSRTLRWFSTINPDSKPADKCPVCPRLREGPFNPDAWKCEHRPSLHTFAMTVAEVATFKAEQCLANVGDAPELVRVKTDARALLPNGAFSYTCPVYFIVGPPGTGKSTIIRYLASYIHDSICAPFSKLAEDYLGVERDGTVVDYKFKTNHRMVRPINAAVAFADEISAMDVRFLYAHVALNRPSCVFIIGDPKQTEIQDPAEGWLFSNHFDVDNISTHTLKYFYRGPQDVAAFCNLYFGYELYAVKDELRSYEVIDINEGLQKRNAQRIYFSDNTKVNLTLGDEAASARAIQGSTVDRVVLFVTAADAHPAGQMRLVRVAMTRHRIKCWIAHDGSPFALQWLAQFDFQLTDDQIREYARPIAAVKAISPLDEDPVLEKIIAERTVEDVKLVGRAEPLRPAPVPKINWAERFSRLTIPAACVAAAAVTYGVITARNSFRPLASGSPFNLVFEIGGRVGSFSTASSILRHFTSVSAKNEPSADLSIPEHLVSSIEGFSHDPLAGGYCWTRLFPEECREQYASELGSHAYLWSLAYRYFHHILAGDAVENVEVVRGHIIAVSEPRNRWYILAKLLFPILCTHNSAGVLSPSPLHLSYLAEHLVLNNFSFYKTGFLSGSFFTRSVRRALLALCISPFTIGGVSTTTVVASCFATVGLLALVGHRRISASAREAFSSATRAGAVEKAIPDDIPKLGEAVGECADYVDVVETYVPDPCECFRTVVDSEEAGVCYVLEKPAHDAFLLAPTLLDTGVSDNSYAINAGADHLIGGEFSNGRFVPDDFFCPVNARGNPARAGETYYQFFQGPGLFYSDKNPWQTMQVIQHRYANADKNPRPLTNDSSKLVDEIVHLFFSECVVENPLATINIAQLQSVFSEFAQASRRKHYAAQFKGLDDADARIVRFHLKRILKPAKGDVKIMKVGQGISAWSKTAQILFAIVGRTLNQLFKRSLRSHCIYDNGYTESQFYERVSAVLQTIPESASNGLCDFWEYDSEQDDFSQALEYRFWARLGVSAELLDHYYSFRRDYKIVAPGISVKVKRAKTSGEPMTLVNNTLINALILNYVFRGTGPFSLVVKGDDGWKVQDGLTVVPERHAAITTATRLRMEASVEDVVEFCGMVVSRSFISPSIIRRLNKACSSRYRDYKHFSEAQKSFREFLKFLSTLDYPKVLATNAERYNVSVELVATATHCLQSLSHISESQFSFHFHKYSVDYGVPSGSYASQTVYSRIC